MQKSIFLGKDIKRQTVEKYFDMVYKLALSQAKDVSLAEDITSDVFLKYIESAKDFESEEHIKAWLIRVTINRAKSIFKSAHYTKTVPLADTLEAEMPKEESDVYEAVLKLPRKYRAAIHLFYYEGYKTAEIAGILKMKEATVRSQLARARQMLKGILEGERADV